MQFNARRAQLAWAQAANRRSAGRPELRHHLSACLCHCPGGAAHAKSKTAAVGPRVRLVNPPAIIGAKNLRT